MTNFISKKVFIYALITVLCMQVGKVGFNRLGEYIYRQQNIKMHVCRVYGPTIIHRPDEDWCNKFLSLYPLSPLSNSIATVRNSCVQVEGGDMKCLDNGRIPLDCIFRHPKEDWCISLGKLSSVKKSIK